MLYNILPFIPAIIAAILVLVIVLTGYVKSPPDKAYIISGIRKNPRILVGRAGAGSAGRCSCSRRTGGGS